MPDSIWDSTLAEFRERLSSVESVPAGVSTAAASAALALSLLGKVLRIASKRKDFAGDRELARSLMEQSREKSFALSELADRDMAAYRERSRDMITVPLQIARHCAAGFALCEQAKPMVHRAVEPDLDAAGTLLSGALRATLFSLNANLEQLPAGDPFREEAAAESSALLQQTNRG
jgi:formiminotetrahydrofolate cyclodeaminase